MKRYKSLYIAVSLFIPLIFADAAQAQQNGGEQEVYLTFRHQNLFNIYVTAYYVDGEFLLPHTEIFRALQIDANADLAAGTVSGQFINEGYYEINYYEGSVNFRGERLSLPPEDYMARELDFFLAPHQFNELFGLEFEIDFSNLALRLSTDKTLPIVSQQERARSRDQQLQRDQTLYREYYPLRFDRERKFMEAGFLDYSLSGNFSQNINNYNFNTGIGMEVVGGDLQGNLFGNWSRENVTLRSNNLRWRYGIRDNSALTQVVAGQTTANGLRPASFTGIQLTNEPLEPRYMFDDYVFSGSTIPDSEVELYRNNTLIDFQRADETGNYHFQIPITYGTSQYNLRSYSPSGVMNEQSTRIQIPFHFLPPGEFNYTLNAGRLDNPILGSTERGQMAIGRVAMGITNWLSLSGGAEYYDTYHDKAPTYSAAISTRLLSKYLFRFEGASNAFYRVNASVVYPSSTSMNVTYTHFTHHNGLYNPAQNRSQLTANLFTPFRIGSLPLYFRWSVNHEQRISTELTRYRIDLNTRLGPLNLRLGYQDNQTGRLGWTITPNSRVTASTTFNFRRSSSLPGFIRGAFLRAQSNFSPHSRKVEDAELQISRSLLSQGRLQLSAGHNFRGDFNYFRLNFSFDFNRVRTNSSARGARGSASITQSIRGSFGFDSMNNRILSSNRQQVGRSAVAVRMFVDGNDNERFDEGETLLDESAVRIQRAGGVIYTEDGITYISQLQPYRQYNLVVNKAAIRNPMLVPKMEQFSFISDPNQFKTIDIPLYMSGVVEGRVQRRVNEEVSEQGGVRLYLQETGVEEGNDPFMRELRTFSDGSFYEYEIPPSTYELYIDPSQLDFLNGVSHPAKHEFNVQAIPEGDFVTGLNFTIAPDGEPEFTPETIHTEPVGAFEPANGTEQRDLQHDIPVESLALDHCLYQVQIGSFSSQERANSLARSAADYTGVPFTVSYYPEISRYAVRTRQLSTFGQAIRRTEEFEESPHINEYAVLSRCTGESFVTGNPWQSNGDTGYEIQIAAFSNLSSAERHAATLMEKFQLHAYVLDVPERELFRVRTGPFTEREEALARIEELIEIGVADQLYLAEIEQEEAAERAQINNQRYLFRLQVDVYDREEDAVADALRIRETFDYETYILVDEEERQHLMLDSEFTDWNQLLQAREDLIQYNGGRTPILHLIER
ncbi:MAG: SPOR domain-containing protein [Balneolaceae bacterium]